MKIFILGSGKVGFAIAQQLDKEGHDITVIDNNPTVINNMANVLDVETLQGNVANIEVLEAAKVNQADLVIAATSSDEINIIACLLARKLNAEHTIARVRNPEYVKSLSALKDELGLSMSINPEMAAAQEIVRTFSFPSQIKVSSFAKGRVELAEIKVKDNTPLQGVSVFNVNNVFKTNVLFCAIERGNEVIIPDGNTTIGFGDKITFTGSTKEIKQFLTKVGIKKQRPVRELMIVGGGKITFYLIQRLVELGVDIKVIEKNYDRCLQLIERFPTVTVIHGDGTDQELLHSESIDEMDAFVALTDNDEENVIVCMYASTQGVVRVIPKVNRVSLGFVLEQLGLENAITPKNITANQIVQYVRAMQNSVGSNVESLMKIVHDKVEILEFRVRENCQFIGKPLKDIQLKKGILVGYISRNGKPMTARGDSYVQLGDTVVIISKLQGLRDINDVLANS